MKPETYVADFDSAAAMLRGLSNCLSGRDFPLLGAVPRWRAPDMKLVAAVVNGMPKALKEQVYIWSGWLEAIAAKELAGARTERIYEWAASLYPKRQYQAVAIGSSNGALSHLWAALGVPWLPQTFLIPVARSGPHPDEPAQDLEWAEEWAPAFLRANPDVQLHHLHDPNQDRLMIRRMTYFRVKRLWLGETYEDFLRQSLEPGGTIFVVECGKKWPVKRVGERNFFQFGAVGGATPGEYHDGGARVEEYLSRYGSHRTHWEPPAADEEGPEAEWGFEPALGKDIERFARRHGFRVRRVLFEEPEDPSPFVADFYRRWNRRRHVLGNRLLVESFIVMEPYWTVRTGSTPFWMVFNKQPSADRLDAYLNAGDPFDEIYMMLFSHGVDSIGLAPIERWRELLERARRKGRFVGVSERAYPRDFAVFARYYFDLKRQIPSRYPLPPPLPVSDLDRFIGEGGEERSRVQWL